MEKEAFQSLLTNLHLQDPDDEIKNKELEMLANSEQLLKQVHQAIKKMDRGQLEKALKFTSAVDNTKFLFTFDSGSEIHYITLEAAKLLFKDKGISNLLVQGVSGEITKADLRGHLVLKLYDPETQETHYVDMGEAHAAASCPMNLLSITLLIKSGCVVHLSQKESYFQVFEGGPKIHFITKNGLFQVVAGPEDQAAESEESIVEDDPSLPIAQVFATTVDLLTWHRRMRHMNVKTLKAIFDRHLVDGFKVCGSTDPKRCGCETCRVAKIQSVPTHKVRQFADPAWHVAHTVSCDIKDVPYQTFSNHKYVLAFRCHWSNFVIVYLMRRKSEAAECLKQYLAEMKRLGWPVKNLVCDRGSEFFTQDGPIIDGRERNQTEFAKVAESFDPKCNINVKGVADHARVAEAFFKESFMSLEPMLFEARLSPAFWGDCLQYYVFLLNETPQHALNGNSPKQLVTGQRPNWNSIRVFGSDAYHVIPNDSLAKVPSVVRGQKLIFLGFDDHHSGYKLYDPNERQYIFSRNAWIYEDFTFRNNNLRQYDAQREFLKKKVEPDVQTLDLFDDEAQAYRNLFRPAGSIDQTDYSSQLPPWGLPRSPEQFGAEEDVDAGAGASKRQPWAGPVDSVAPSSQSDVSAESNEVKPECDPLNIKSEHIRQQVQSRVGKLLRPLRLLPAGRNVNMTPADKDFVRLAHDTDMPVLFKQQAKSLGSKSGDRYRKYSQATTLREAKRLGMSNADINHDYAHGFIQFPANEPDLPGHVFEAQPLAKSCGYIHVLEEYGLSLKRDAATYKVLVRVFNAQGKQSFQRLIKTALESFPEEEVFLDQRTAARFAEASFMKVLNASTVKVDYSLPP